MNKILLALTILGAGAGGFLTARQTTTQLQHEANVTRAAWLTQTQLVAGAHSDQATLMERVGELKQTLRRAPAAGENALWSALQTNRAGQLPPEVREHLLEELGFNWQSSEEFIMVSKETLRDIRMQTMHGGKLTEIAATVLALTPAERGQVEAAIQRVQTDFNDWALSHTERSEPKDDVLAQYTLPGDPAMSQSISNSFADGVFAALGRERGELIRDSARNWMLDTIGFPEKPTTVIVKRNLVGNEPRLKVQIHHGTAGTYWEDLSKRRLPAVFLPIFPNGWADVAKREGFEMPKESQEK
jgi:hypothetical protein